MALEITIVFFAMLFLGANSAPSNLKASSVTKPEENEEKRTTGIQLQCYTGKYTSETILKNGLQQLSDSQVCPDGSSCFIRKMGEKFTFGCAKKNSEIVAGKCINITSQIITTKDTNNFTDNIEKSSLDTITECHCHTNKCLVLSIFGKSNLEKILSIFGRPFSPNLGRRRCQKLACGLLELDGIIGVILLSVFLCVGLILTPIIYSRSETAGNIIVIS